MQLDRSKPCPVSYLKRKSMEVDLEAQTGCLSGCDGCAGYVPTPQAGKPDNQQYSVFKLPDISERLRVVTDIPVRKKVQAPQSRYQRLLKGLTKYLQSCYNGDTIIAIALSQSGVEATELIMGRRRTPIRLRPV